MKNEKKVVLFLVEGASDEAALGTAMNEYFAGEQVRFLVAHGDITVKDYVSADSIIKKINERIAAMKEKYRFRTGDFLKIIHLVDTDGVFIPDKQVCQADVPAVRYYEDHMDTKAVDAIVDRNHQKAEILFKLHKTGKIGSIPYRVYYNSCNLEHVLFDELNHFTKEEKEEMSDEFAERYEDRIREFISFLSSPELAVPGTYQETWEYIETDLNSLGRHTNMHQIFLE